jgi:Tfp pilus assembly ATPase PilU
MQSFDHALIELYKAGFITPEDCVRNSDNANDMKLKLKTLPTFIRSSGRED